VVLGVRRSVAAAVAAVPSREEVFVSLEQSCRSACKFFGAKEAEYEMTLSAHKVEGGRWGTG